MQEEKSEQAAAMTDALPEEEELPPEEDESPFPTVEEWMELFSRPEIMQMPQAKYLKAHFSFPDYRASGAQLAEKVGHKGPASTRSQYGRLCHILANNFGWGDELYSQCRANGYGFDWVCFLLTWEPAGKGDFYYMLRPEAVEALKRLGW